MIRLPKNSFDGWAAVLFCCGIVHAGLTFLLILGSNPGAMLLNPADWFLGAILCVIGSRVHDFCQVYYSELERQQVMRQTENLDEPIAAPPLPKVRRP